MPIDSFSEEEQTPLLKIYNETQTEKNKIPGLLRNYHSGWPLLQVSLLSITKDTTDPINYIPVLGGGNCHFFYIGAFNFASLLTKIPGRIEISIPFPPNPKREFVKADNIHSFLRSYSIYHKKWGIKISSNSGFYGKNLNVVLPEGNANQFRDALTHSFSFALKKGASLKAIDGWTDSEYTQKEIEEAINPGVAVFHNGQIFIDLGMLLEQKVKDAEVIALFKNLFKIEPFLELRHQYPEFKPNTLKAVEVIQEAPAKTPELSKFKTTSFFQEEKKEPSLIDGQAFRVSCQR